jgi:hypothetical protein
MRRSRGRRLRRPGSRLALAAVLVTAAMAIAGGTLASSAAAYSSGIYTYCGYVYLPAYNSCADFQYHSSFVQVESWNADAKGVGSCAAVGNASGSVWYDYVCVASGSGYNAALCSASCNWDAGYGQVANDASWGSVFTGWGQWR